MSYVYKNINSKCKCDKPDCSYYGIYTKTCDYRLITGKGRGEPIEACTKFTTEEVKKVDLYENLDITEGFGFMESTKTKNTRKLTRPAVQAAKEFDEALIETTKEFENAYEKALEEAKTATCDVNIAEKKEPVITGPDTTGRDIIEETYSRAQMILQSIMPKDSVKLKASALQLVHDIIDQAETRLCGGETV